MPKHTEYNKCPNCGADNEYFDFQSFYANPENEDEAIEEQECHKCGCVFERVFDLVYKHSRVTS